MTEYLTNEELRDVVIRSLDGERIPVNYYICLADCQCCDIGMEFGPDGIIYTVPGWASLWSPESKVVNLDFLYDVPDDAVKRLRGIVVSALEASGRDFIPVSRLAFARLRATYKDITMVHRVGMECVFSVNDKYYISGYDHNEEPPLYFLARLPHAVSTYDESIEALKPESVKLAEAQGIAVLRQGDMFAIQTDYTDADLREMGAKFAYARLYGTSHVVSDAARLPDGTVFGRGEMKHVPSNRRADHADLKLVPDSWYLIVKNTVPTIQSERG
jgi:hypothetical protein